MDKNPPTPLSLAHSLSKSYAYMHYDFQWNTSPICVYSRGEWWRRGEEKNKRSFRPSFRTPACFFTSFIASTPSHLLCPHSMYACMCMFVLFYIAAAWWLVLLVKFQVCTNENENSTAAQHPPTVTVHSYSRGDAMWVWSSSSSSSFSGVRWRWRHGDAPPAAPSQPWCRAYMVHTWWEGEWAGHRHRRMDGWIDGLVARRESAV